MSITRIEILHRAATQWPLNTVPYNQSGSHADKSGRKWRTDCSGFVSMCLNLIEGAVGGRNTVGLVTDGSPLSTTFGTSVHWLSRFWKSKTRGIVCSWIVYSPQLGVAQLLIQSAHFSSSSAPTTRLPPRGTGPVNPVGPVSPVGPLGPVAP